MKGGVAPLVLRQENCIPGFKPPIWATQIASELFIVKYSIQTFATPAGPS